MQQQYQHQTTSILKLETFSGGALSHHYTNRSSPHSTESSARVVGKRLAAYVAPIVMAATFCSNYEPTPIGLHSDTNIQKTTSTQTINSIKIETRYTVQSWLSSFYESSLHADTTRDVLPLVSFIRGYMRAKDYQALDSLLDVVDVKKMSVTAQMVLLRTLFGVKDKLIYWNPTLNIVKDELDSRHENSAFILHGLI